MASSYDRNIHYFLPSQLLQFNKRSTDVTNFLNLTTESIFISLFPFPILRWNQVNHIYFVDWNKGCMKQLESNRLTFLKEGRFPPFRRLLTSRRESTLFYRKVIFPLVFLSFLEILTWLNIGKLSYLYRWTRFKDKIVTMLLNRRSTVQCNKKCS